MNNHNVSNALSNYYNLPLTHPKSKDSLKASVLTRVEASSHAKDMILRVQLLTYGPSNMRVALETIDTIHDSIDLKVRKDYRTELNNYLATKSFFKRPFLRTKIERELDTLVRSSRYQHFSAAVQSIIDSHADTQS